MRLLVACPHCLRQYDASLRETGSRFRCHCGEGLQVRKPRGHSADVVRCSSCGGPREKGALACGFCEADFSIHEKDLDTVCPGCLAVISDRARYCHHCGLGIQPELAVGKATKLPCPQCGQTSYLSSRVLGNMRAAALECTTCGGLWLGSEVFQKLIDQSTAGAIPPLDQHAPRDALPTMHDDAEWRYRRCPVCSQFMQRKNYGRLSGVIVDHCRGHGLWFDANELPRILAWVRRGGLKDTAGRAAEETKAAQWRSDLDRHVSSGGTLQEATDDTLLGALFQLFW